MTVSGLKYAVSAVGVNISPEVLSPLRCRISRQWGASRACLVISTLGIGVLSFSQNTPAAVRPGSRLRQSAVASTRLFDRCSQHHHAATSPSTPQAVAAVGLALAAMTP